MSDSQFIQSGSPYIHSNIYHFRNDVSGIQSELKKSQEFEQAIKLLENISEQLKRQADEFLEGKSYQQVSKDLFNNTNNYNSIAIQIFNQTDFVDFILAQAQLNPENKNLNNIITPIADKLGEIDFTKPSTAKIIAGHVVDNIFSNFDKNTVSIESAIDKTSYSQLLTTLQQEQHRVLIKNSEQFKKDIAKQIRKTSQINWNSVFEEFSHRFKEKIAQSKIIYDENNSPESYLEKLKQPFLSKMQNVYANDISNLTGVISEDIKDVILNNGVETEITWFNVGSMNENDLVKKFQNQIPKLLIRGNESTKSESDWVLINSKGYKVRAQDKNSIGMLQELENQSKKVPQIIKIQDTILYETLKQNLQAYENRILSNDDWATVDYLIGNSLWFRTKASLVRGKSSNQGSSVGGVMGTVNQILTSEVGYFLGVQYSGSLEEVAIAAGSSNVFFVIDNVLLYPTYLIINYLIKQLKDEEDQLIKLQVTLNPSLPSGMPTPMGFWKEKMDANDGPYIPGSSYSDEVLNIGKRVGFEIINSAKINRINMRMNIQQIYLDAYNLAKHK